jgi:hypothetical protein
MHNKRHGDQENRGPSCGANGWHGLTGVGNVRAFEVVHSSAPGINPASFALPC